MHITIKEIKEREINIILQKLIKYSLPVSHSNIKYILFNKSLWKMATSLRKDANNYSAGRSYPFNSCEFNQCDNW